MAVVDTACDDDFLELVRNSLLSALLAIGPHALFGLVTLSSRIGVWDLQGSVPAVRHVAVASRGGDAGSALLQLSDVLPLEVRMHAGPSRRHCGADIARLRSRAGVPGRRGQVAGGD